MNSHAKDTLELMCGKFNFNTFLREIKFYCMQNEKQNPLFLIVNVELFVNADASTVYTMYTYFRFQF